MNHVCAAVATTTAAAAAWDDSVSILFVLVQIYFRIAINTMKSYRKSLLRKQSESHALTVQKNNNNTSRPAAQPASQPNDAQIQYDFQLRNHIRADRVSTCVVLLYYMYQPLS